MPQLSSTDTGVTGVYRIQLDAIGGKVVSQGVSSAEMAIGAPAWDLTSALPHGVETEHMLLLEEIKNLQALFDAEHVDGGNDIPTTAENAIVFDRITLQACKVFERERVLSLFLAGIVWSDAANDEAARRYARVTTEACALRNLKLRLQAWTARFEPSRLSRLSNFADMHRLWLERSRKHAKNRMPEVAEEIAAQLAQISGVSAWRSMRESIIARLTVNIYGNDIPIALVGSHTTSKSRSIRHAAYDATETSLASISIPAAAALNAIAGERLLLAERRGYKNPLQQALTESGMDEADLHSIHKAIDSLQPDLSVLVAAKANCLGIPAEDFSWWDISAPLPNEKPVTWAAGMASILESFARSSPALAAHARTAINSQWIDAQPRPGKRPKGLCLPLRNGESRLMVVFDGNIDSLFSVSHELGHAYHYWLLRNCTELQRSSPLVSCEIPSLWCESLLSKNAATDGELAWMSSFLSRTMHRLVTLRARFIFEESFLCLRHKGPLPTDEICRLYAEARRQATGGCINTGQLPYYGWILDHHLYTGNHSAWPYYSAMLIGFALPLAASAHARDIFEHMLPRTGTHGLRDLIMQWGGDMRCPDFWMSGANVIRSYINDFVAFSNHAIKRSSSSGAAFRDLG